ncbi:MAG: hypothetical protein IT306_06270 [Chloroflexi bacterium]|nr:hypothetical protein [Chloroflexota bacterium]
MPAEGARQQRPAASLRPPRTAWASGQTYQTGFRYACYSNPDLDKLIDAGASTASRDERIKIYLQALAVIDKDPPGVPLFAPDDFYAGAKKMAGFAPRASQLLDVRSITPG